MKRNKMSLANITERLSRAEMKKILAGDRDPSASGCWEHHLGMDFCVSGNTCTFRAGGSGTCATKSDGTGCFCVGAT